MKRKHQNPTAMPYAQAAFDLANKTGEAEQLGRELAGVRSVVESAPSFANYLRDPGVPDSQRSATVEKVFKGKVSPLLWSLIGVMRNKRRLGILADVADGYLTLLDKQLGMIDVDMTVAHALDAPALEEVRQRVGKAFAKTVVLNQKVDESILGGLVLRIEDKLIDASVKTQLENLKKDLIAAAPR